MSGGGNNFSNGQFGGLPLGGGQGGQGSVPARPQMPGQQGGGFGQRPMMGNRPMYATPFQGMQGGGMGMAQPAVMPQTGGLEQNPGQNQMYPQGFPGRQAPQQAPGQMSPEYMLRAMRGG